ncbi:MAG: tol-pal system protein YbgF [Gammaproteobacteria bacterium]
MKLKHCLLLFSLLLLQQQALGQEDSQSPADKINARLDRIEQLLSRSALLQILQQLRALQEQVSQLQGQLELQHHTLEQVKKQQRDLYIDIDQRLQRMESGGMPTAGAMAANTLSGDPGGNAPPLERLSPLMDSNPNAGVGGIATDDNLMVQMIRNTTADPPQEQQIATAPDRMPTAPDTIITPAGEADAPTSPNPVQAEADYQHAFKLLQQSLYDQSIKAFQAFLQSHPENESADKAQFWLAEAYFVTGAHNEALVEYLNLIANYPDSQKITHAKLKIGRSYQELGQLDAARVILTQLIDDHPSTTAARLAQERLDMLATQPSGEGSR